MPVRLKNHAAIVFKSNLFIFGGEAHTNESINDVYVFDFVDEIWKKPKVSGKVPPKVDSHACCECDGKMYVYGGFMSETAEYMKSIYCLDL